jgi:enoyl-CoA hydratase
MGVRAASDIASEEICIRVDGWLGRITLNRPKSINALTFGMVQEIARALTLWRADPSIRAVMLDGAGERGFCAGGDVRALYDHRTQPAFLIRYWREEYILDHAIATYPKPVIAFMDGLTMGGGAGLGVNASHRIVSETTRFAMPETGIGLVPDVGASWFLSRCPDNTGVWLAMTGEAIGAGDMLELGLADAFRETSGRETFLAQLHRALDGAESVADRASLTLARLGRSTGSLLSPHRDAIRRCFAARTVEGVLASLDTEGGAWARGASAAIQSKSPLMQKVAMRAIQLGERAPDLAHCLATEFRIVSRVAVGHEFLEGVRAAVVDKDHRPRWRPSKLDDVGDALVDPFFAPLEDELVIPHCSPERVAHV